MELIRAEMDDVEKIWKMQVEAFQGLYRKYQDTETSPATEKPERIMVRMNQPFTYYYFIRVADVDVGVIRVVDAHDSEKAKRISPIFIMEEYRGNGYAQEAIRLAEEIHGAGNWELDTILQEKGNCYLYEKMGYRQTGKTEVVNDKMTLVFYKKD